MILSQNVLKVCSGLRKRQGIFIVGDVLELVKHELSRKNVVSNTVRRIFPTFCAISIRKWKMENKRSRGFGFIWRVVEDSSDG